MQVDAVMRKLRLRWPPTSERTYQLAWL